MRNLFAFLMVSVDGYFEGVNHDLSWHHTDAEFLDFCHDQNSRIGTLLFGHQTYDLMAGFWPTPQGTAVDPETAVFMNATPKVVVSRSPFKPEWNKTTAVSANLIDEVRKLKAQPGKDTAIFGSNRLLVSLMASSVVDEVRILIEPVALGKGTPLFAGLDKSVKLKLIATRGFNSGNVLHRYVPAS
jgi:dihydrofolate reductase